jgi:hypothetical protein
MRRSKERPPQLPEEAQYSSGDPDAPARKRRDPFGALKRAAKDAIVRQTSTKRR